MDWLNWFRRRPNYTQAYAQAWADIEREYPLEQMRAESRMRALQARIARDALRQRLDGGGEYQRGEPGLQ